MDHVLSPGIRAGSIEGWDARAQIEQWGGSECLGFLEIPISGGLPKGWSLFAVNAALDDAGIRNSYSLLSFPRSIRLRVDGGIRVTRGNQFFGFAPPNLVLEGDSEEAQFYANGVHVPCSTPGEPPRNRAA